MKFFFTFLLFSISLLSFGQDTLKKKPTPIQKQVAPTAHYKFPSTSLGTTSKNKKNPVFSGNYVLDKYEIQVKNKSTRKTIKVISSATFYLSKGTIVGPEIDSILYQIIDTEIMDTEDFLYRNFNVIPDKVPTDLPKKLTVFKTDNPSYYGIVRLRDNRLILPYKGLLIYLRKV